MAVVNSGGTNIYYEVHGKGEPLVLIMGYGLNSGSWLMQVPFFSQYYRVVTFDNRGTGRSDKPQPPYTFNSMVGDLVNVLDAEGIQAAHIFGVSMGGYIAQQFALSYPQKVKTLILGCTTCGGSHGIQSSDEARAVLHDFDRMQRLTLEERARGVPPFLFSLDFLKNNLEVLKKFASRLGEYPTPIHGYMGQTAAMKDFDTYERLPEIKVPTLVIAGDVDRLIPVENSRILASRIPGAEMFIVKNTGHGFCMEAPEQTNQAVLDFLLRHRDIH